MNSDPISLIAIAAIISVTMISAIALIRNSAIELNLKLGKNILNIKGNRKPFSSQIELKKVECLPVEENRQLLDCDS